MDRDQHIEPLPPSQPGEVLIRCPHMIARTLLLAALTPALFAQWPAWPAANPDLTGPAAKAADGHPDLSGVWDRGLPPGAQPGQPGPAPGQGPRPFQDLPSMLPGGLPMLPW